MKFSILCFNYKMLGLTSTSNNLNHSFMRAKTKRKKDLRKKEGRTREEQWELELEEKYW